MFYPIRYAQLVKKAAQNILYVLHPILYVLRLFLENLCNNLSHMLCRKFSYTFCASFLGKFMQ